MMPETIDTSDETRERTTVKVTKRRLSSNEQQRRIESRDRLNPGGSE